MSQPLDERNQTWVSEMQASLDSTRGAIQQGHVVRFADGTLRVVSHVWMDATNQPASIQTSDLTAGDARLHLCNYRGLAYLEYSGGLYCDVPFDTFTQTSENAQVAVWFWNHQISGAGRGVYTMVSVPIWDCALLPNSV